MNKGKADIPWHKISLGPLPTLNGKGRDRIGRPNLNKGTYFIRIVCKTFYSLELLLHVLCAFRWVAVLQCISHIFEFSFVLFSNTSRDCWINLDHSRASLWMLHSACLIWHFSYTLPKNKWVLNVALFLYSSADGKRKYSSDWQNKGQKLRKNMADPKCGTQINLCQKY